MLANVSKIITMFSALSGMLTLIPAIKALVQQIEETGSLSGAEKKEAVLKLLTAGIPALETAFGIQLPDDLIKQWAGSIIDAIVVIENLAGNFKHKVTVTAQG